MLQPSASERVECDACHAMTAKPDWPNDTQFVCEHCGVTLTKTAARYPPGETAFVATKAQIPNARLIEQSPRLLWLLDEIACRFRVYKPQGDFTIDDLMPEIEATIDKAR